MATLPFFDARIPSSPVGFALAVALVFFFSGCNSDSKPEESAQPAEIAQAEPQSESTDSDAEHDDSDGEVSRSIGDTEENIPGAEERGAHEFEPPARRHAVLVGVNDDDEDPNGIRFCV